MVVTGESKNTAEAVHMLNAKGASMPDRCLKGVQVVASEMEDSGYVEKLYQLYLFSDSKNNGKDNGRENTGVRKGQGKKVVYINLSKRRKRLTVKVAFKGYDDLYAKFTSKMMQKECTGFFSEDTLRRAFPDKAASYRNLQRHVAKGRGGMPPDAKGRA